MRTSFGMGCAADAPERFARAAAAPDDFLMTLEVDDEFRQAELEAEVRKVQQAQAAGQSLSDIFTSRVDTYRLGVHPLVGDGIRFDGTVRAVDGGLVIVVPAEEVVPQANWWQKVIAFGVSFAAGVLSTVVCLAFFTVGAPLASPVCTAVGGFVTGMVGELMNAWFDDRAVDSEVWAEAFAMGICGALAGALLGKFMPWAELNSNPLMVSLGKSVRELASTVATEFGEAIGYAAGTLVRVGGQLYEKLLAVMARRGIKGAPTALRVMPLGDSITAGAGSSTGSSYRADLWNGLSADQHVVDFVGSRQSGRLPDVDHEGVSGDLISQIAARSRTAVGLHRPNVVTIHAGTNDMDRNVDPAGAPARLGAMIDQILADSPEVTVLVATLVPSRDAVVQKRIDAFNREVEDLAEQRSKAGKKVRAVSMGPVTATDLVDRLHPNDGGYRKMADVFHHAIDQSILSGMVKGAGPGPACNDAPGGWVARGRIAAGVPLAATEHIAFADVDGDRRDDYLAVDRASGAVRAWLNRGGDSGDSAGWVARGQIAAGVPLGAADSVSFADIDGDHRDDYLVTNASTGAVRAWLNRGGDSGDSAGWVARGQIAAGVPLSAADSIVFGQADCGRLSDYLVVDRSTGAVRAWLNRGGDSGDSAGWVARGRIAAGTGGGEVVFADMDGDGRDDYLTLDAAGVVRAWLNRGGDPA
ncbi:GDSL-type esterase/lipase family protein [Streptomyces roseolilacinus]|uniref:GDSL-type esterase/lipase family protein n=1 Tax=Streptomyces roseolilacinus TaxID=66904 RepID=UPI00167AAD2B|nr:GDSL-type esterase/lipase family protein [Streptomyces roseolilacinus]